MKKTRQIVTLITVFSFLLNSVPVYAVGDYNDSSSQDININSNLEKPIDINWILQNVIIKDKVYDGSDIAEADCSEIVRILKDDFKLDVTVSAEAYFSDINASDNVSVTVSSFLVEGIDSDKVTFEKSLTINKSAKIFKKTIVLLPQISSVYYGQDISQGIPVKCSEEDVLSEISIPEKIQIDFNNGYDETGRLKPGKYKYIIPQIELENYVFSVEENSIFTIEEYKPEAEAYDKSGAYLHLTDKTVLTAPEGFLISKNKSDFNDDSTSVNVELTDTYGEKRNSITYYLKNNDSTSDAFGAVSVQKSYSYLCVSKAPQISSIELYKKENDNSSETKDLSSLETVKNIGKLSDKTVVMKVKAIGPYYDKDSLKFTLYDAAANEETGSFLPSSVNNTIDGTYEFELAEDVTFEDMSLRISVKNDFGESDLTDLINENNVPNHLIIDTAPPVITEDSVIIRYNNEPDGMFFVADGIVTDSGSGISKIEYRWDDCSVVSEYNIADNKSVAHAHNHNYYEGTAANHIINAINDVDQKNDLTSFVPGADKGRNKVLFRILVPYNQSHRTEDNYHTLHLTIYDYAGNKTNIESKFLKNGSGGKDVTPPVINYLDINSSKPINYLPSGNYSKDSFEFTVRGEDRGDTSNYISGLSHIEILDEKDEQVFLVSVNDEAEENLFLRITSNFPAIGAKIKISDKGKVSETASITEIIKDLFSREDIDQTLLPAYLKNVKSNDFIVDRKIPDVSDNFESIAKIFTPGNENLNNSDKKVFIYRSEKDSSDGSEKESTDDVWIGKEGSKIGFSITDEDSGINNVKFVLTKIKDEHDNLIESKISEYIDDYSSKTERILDSGFEDDLSKLDTGYYYYYSQVTDNAGNEFLKEDYRKFYVDDIEPDSNITVSSSVDKPVVNIKYDNKPDEYWVDKDGEFTFNIYATDNYSGVKNVTVYVNDQEFDFNGANQFSYFSSQKGSQKLTITKSDILAQNISMESDQTYKVKVVVTDFAENKSIEKEPFVLHIDEEAPKIDSVEVKKVVTPYDHMPDVSDKSKLNLLEFGLFSNASVTFSVKVSDKEFDSGIDTLTAYFWEPSHESASAVDSDSDVSEAALPVIFTVDNNDITFNEETGCYEFTVKLVSGTAFNKNLKLVVKDKYGKTCSEYEKIILRSGEEEKSTVSREEKTNDYIENYVNVIVEDIVPDMNIGLTVPDYIDKENRIWFNDISKAVLLNVQDIDSGLRRVSVFLNDINHISDFDETELCNEPDARITNQYGYRFFTGMGYTDESDYPSDGRFVYKFESEDNSGNKTSYPKVNNIDYISPDDINHIEEDEDGNITAYAKQYTYYIDRYAPDVKNVVFEPVTVDGKENTESFKEEPEIFLIDDLYYGLFFNNDFDLKVYPEDHGPSSGLRCVNYRLISYETPDAPVKTDEGESAVNEEGYAVIHISKGFKGRIILSATDNVGNTSPEQYMDAYISEDKAPDLSINFMNETKLHDGDGNELYTEDVAVEVTVSDIQSGIRSCKVDISSEKTGENGFSEIINITDLINAGESGSFNGWHIEKTEANLITEIRKSFVFSSDDNNIRLQATAQDNCFNEISEPVSSRTFTIDKTDPVINVSYTDGFNGTEYYNKDNKAVITLDITERNFDSGLIKTRIENSFNGNVPAVEFSSSSSDKHKAVLTFSEGDYIFSVSGSDLAGHNASVNAPYEGTRRFFVDETDPDVTTNFDKFVYEDKDIFFNSPQKGTVTVREHNFDQNKVNLKLMTKQPGSDHSEYNMNDNVYSFIKYSDWKTNESDPDLHTLEFELDKDNVYQLIITPEDKAGNKGAAAKSSVFEIDTTIPTVTKKNDQFVSGKENETEFLDIYTESRSGEPVPTIEFDDTNFDHLEYSLIKYVPDGKENRELGKIEAKSESGIVTDKKFTLEKFDEDGTYYVEIKAVDKAGNSSVINKNTYVRMKEKEVLAYIPDSSIERKTGIFSLEYENGDAISMRPESFSDIDIVVMAKDRSDVKILLRDMNGDEKDTMLSPESEDESMYGVGVYTYKLKREFFIDNYQNDTDSELNLSVKNGDDRIDLARIHIDNISPTGDTDSKFKSWHWYPGKEPQNIVVSNISELLNVDECKVFDKGAEIPFEYSEADKTISFMLDEGWHDIGVHLEDYAGNKFDIQQVDNIHVGYFWLWVILGGVMAAGGTAAFVLLRKKFKK